MRLVSWNVNGLRACAGKGFEEAFKALDADFFCLQETKMQEGQLDLQFDGYEPYWNYADKKVETEDFFLVNAYVPNAQDGLRRLDYRMKWEDDFRAYLQDLDAKKPVVLCGDLNVAHQEIDLKNPKTNRRNAGFTDEERAKFGSLLEAGFSDTFRRLYPDKVTYSWWSYRFRAREKNAGWRIDYFVVSNRLFPQVTDSIIHTEVMGSDHCPVEITIED